MTRNEYMEAHTGKTREEQAALHRAFYAQLVSPATVRCVVNYIGKERLLKATDPHLNDIPLILWDKLAGSLTLACSFKSLGDYATLAGWVCVAKEAARQFIESHNESQGTTK